MPSTRPAPAAAPEVFAVRPPRRRRPQRHAAVCGAAVLGAVGLAGPVGLTGQVARGGTVVVHQLGEQDFASGAGPVWVEQVRAAGRNEMYPFDGTVFGDDRNPLFGKVSFGFSFDAPPAAADGARPDGTLTLGLIGLDSPPGSPATVRLFLNGVEQPNAAFAGASSAEYKSSASVVSVPVSGTLLAGGTLDVTVKASRASRGFSGNAIEADFATLAVAGSDLPPPTTGNPPPGGVPGGDPGTPGGNPSGPGTGGTPGGGGPTPGGPGTDPGDGSHPGGGGGDHPGPGGGGGSSGPPPSVPLPPSVLTGALGLACAWVLRRKA